MPKSTTSNDHTHSSLEQVKSCKTQVSSLEDIIERLKTDLDISEQKLGKRETEYNEMETQLNSDVQYFKSLYEELKKTSQQSNEQNSYFCHLTQKNIERTVVRL